MGVMSTSSRVLLLTHEYDVRFDLIPLDLSKLWYLNRLV